MTTVATLDTIMRLNSTAFRQGMIEAAGQANRSLTSIQKQASETASVLLQLKRAAGAAGSFYLVKQGFDGLVEAQKQLQAIHYTFQAATGSATKAAEAMSFVRKEGDQLGLVLPDSAEGFAKLSASATAAGVAMSDQQALFDAYAKSSTTLHLSTTQSSRALLALEQMFAKGKIQAQELRLQLGQAIPGAAMHFQNAVMEMTKGTNLAGKSFDQLLEAGDLTTSKFLPALVTALQQSGKGWEQASHGLQAELNRVQTAWFNLKSEVSGGLFNDAVTGGARLLANNLSLVANAIAAIGAGTAARLIGSGIAGGVGKVERLQQEYRGAQLAAAAEREYAEAVLKNAEATAIADKATVAGIASTKQSVTVARQATRAAIEQAAAGYQAALAQKEAAVAFAAKHAGNGSAIVQEAVADRQLAAQNALTAATARYEAARAGANSLQETANVQNSLLTKSNLVLAASEDAVAAAQVRVAETRAAEAAIGGLGAAAGRAAKSFGAFAMSLVGGPWGVATLAIGGLAYAIYSSIKASEEYRAETQEQVKSLQAQAAAAKAAADEYGRLGSKQTLSQGVDTLGASTEEIKKRREELSKLRDEKVQLNLAMASGHAGMLAGRDMENLKDRIKELEAELPQAESATGALSDALRARLTPAVDGLRNAIEAVRNGGGLGGFIRALASPEDVERGTQAIEHAQQLANAAYGAMTSLGDKARKDLLTKGKSRVDQLDAELAVAVANIKAQRLDAVKEAGAIKAAQAEYDKQLPDSRKADIADNAKKNASAINAEADAFKNFTASQRGQLETLQAQVDGTAKGTEAQRALNVMLAGGTAEFRKMTPAHQAEVLASQKHIVALTNEANALQLAAAATKQLADLDRQLAEQRTQQDRENSRQLEGMAHGALWNQQRAGIEAIQDAYRKQREEADKTYESAVSQATATGNLAQVQAQLDATHAQAIGKVTVAEAQAVMAQRQFYAEQATLRADWRVGAISAMEDWRDAALDASKAAADAMTNAATNMTDALTTFTMTGKLDFKSFADSVIRDLVRIAYQRAIAGIFESVIGAYMGTPSGYNSASPSSQVAYDVAQSGGRASGGPVGPGKLYQVAEGNRPELLTSAGRTYLMMGQSGGSVTPVHAGGGAGGASGGVSVVIENHTSVQPEVKQSRGANGGSIITVLMKQVDDRMAANAANPNSNFGKNLRSTFGLQRRGVPVGG